MLHRFREVNPKVFRGSAPSIEDLIFLNKKVGINKIISLDADVSKRIHRAVILLGMEHVQLPIEIGKLSSLINFLKHDIVKLLEDNGPSFTHCAQGKDRTSVAIALYRCQHDKWTPEQAIQEAKKLGFGIGLPDKIVKLYERIIRRAGSHEKEDNNQAWDIVENQREYPSDYQDYTLGPWEQQSWSPYSDYRVREFPYANVDIDWPEQYDSRITYDLDDSDLVKHRNIKTPQVGQWDENTQGIAGISPSFISGYV